MPGKRSRQRLFPSPRLEKPLYLGRVYQLESINYIKQQDLVARACSTLRASSDTNAPELWKNEATASETFIRRADAACFVAWKMLPIVSRCVHARVCLASSQKSLLAAGKDQRKVRNTRVHTVRRQLSRRICVWTTCCYEQTSALKTKNKTFPLATS